MENISVTSDNPLYYLNLQPNPGSKDGRRFHMAKQVNGYA
jgi:hypothetical protein